MTFWMMQCRPVNSCEMLLKRKIEQNTSAIRFYKVQLLLLDIFLSLPLVYLLLKLNFKIHSLLTLDIIEKNTTKANQICKMFQFISSLNVAQSRAINGKLFGWLNK